MKQYSRFMLRPCWAAVEGQQKQDISHKKTSSNNFSLIKLLPLLENIGSVFQSLKINIW